jgi:hypothetical protein
VRACVQSNQLNLIKFFQLTKKRKKNGYLGQKKQTKKRKKTKECGKAIGEKKKEKIKNSISTGGGRAGEFSTVFGKHEKLRYVQPPFNTILVVFQLFGQ